MSAVTCHESWADEASCPCLKVVYNQVLLFILIYSQCSLIVKLVVVSVVISFLLSLVFLFMSGL